MVKILTRLVLRRRRAVLVIALLVALLGGSAGSTLFSKLSAGGWDDPGAESGQAAQILESSLGHRAPNLVLMVTAEGTVDDPDATRGHRPAPAACC